MRYALLILLALAPAAATAQDALYEMAGSWSGHGTYLDRNIDEALRCRLTISTDAEASEVRGACASARRREDIHFVVLRERDGSLRSRTVQDTGARRPMELTGGLTPNGVRLAGRRAQQDITLKMALRDTEQARDRDHPDQAGQAAEHHDGADALGGVCICQAAWSAQEHHHVQGLARHRHRRSNRPRGLKPLPADRDLPPSAPSRPDRAFPRRPARLRAGPRMRKARPRSRTAAW